MCADTPKLENQLLTPEHDVACSSTCYDESIGTNLSGNTPLLTMVGGGVSAVLSVRMGEMLVFSLFHFEYQRWY
jgi:hypothetical protein